MNAADLAAHIVQNYLHGDAATLNSPNQALITLEDAGISVTINYEDHSDQGGNLARWEAVVRYTFASRRPVTSIECHDPDDGPDLVDYLAREILASIHESAFHALCRRGIEAREIHASINTCLERIWIDAARDSYKHPSKEEARLTEEVANMRDCLRHAESLAHLLRGTSYWEDAALELCLIALYARQAEHARNDAGTVDLHRARFT